MSDRMVDGVPYAEWAERLLAELFDAAHDEDEAALGTMRRLLDDNRDEIIAGKQRMAERERRR